MDTPDSAPHTRRDSRRAFLKAAGGAVAAVTVGGMSGLAGCQGKRPPPPPPPRQGDASIPTHYVDPHDVLAHLTDDAPATPPADPLFPSVFMGGFESSNFRRRDFRRIDVIAQTRHDVFAEQDYARLKAVGMTACRDTARWVLIDPPGRDYDFSSLLPMLQAARRQRMTVIWDLFHYGYPDDLDVFGSRFVDRFVRYAQATAKVIDGETDGEHVFFTPVNEISFITWAAADYALFHPYERGRGFEMKTQLARAAIQAMDRIKDVCPRARFMHCDPTIHVLNHAQTEDARRAAEAYRQAQFQGFDMISGRLWPQLGGHPKYLDIVGINYYRNNQNYFDGGQFVDGTNPRYRPLRTILLEIWDRYRRPMMIAETGIENELRAPWMRYVGGECAAAMAEGCPIHSITWYPIVNHPGWEDERHVHNGLWDYPDDQGNREIHQPLADEMQRQQPALAKLRAYALRATRAKVYEPDPELPVTPGDIDLSAVPRRFPFAPPTTTTRAFA